MTFYPETQLRTPFQALALDRDRILVLVPGKRTVLRGISLEVLALVVSLLDGSRSKATLIETLAEEFPRAGVETTLATLLQEIPCAHALEQPDPVGYLPSMSRHKLLMVGDSDMRRQASSFLPKHWDCSWQQLPKPNPSTPFPGYFQSGFESPLSECHETALPLPKADLVVVWLNGQTLADIRSWEEDTLKLGRPILYVAQCPTGWELGPLTVPGLPGFWDAYTQSLPKSIFRGAPPNLLAPLRTFPWQVTQSHMAHFVAEVERLFLSQANPTSLGKVCHFEWETGNRRLRELSVASSPEPPSNAELLTPLAQRCLATYWQNLKPKARIHPTSDPENGSDFTLGIVGGGTAGYLAALAFRQKHPRTELTLIESPDVPVIGVGEATTPLMLQFLHVDLCIDIHDFFQKVRPTFKLGIGFDWGPPQPGSFPYPFGPMHLFTPETRVGDFWSLSRQSLLMKAGKLDLSQQGSHRVKAHWDRNLAYHLDNRRFVAYLQELAQSRGIRIKKAHIAQVETNERATAINALHTATGERLRFDGYVDCTGFRALLLKGALGSPFKSFDKTLFTNRALIGRVPNSKVTPPYTRATSMNAGWCWNTPQRTAHHVGYVFSSDFLSEDQAEEELRALYPEVSSPGLVRFHSGRHQHFFRGNVAALGNAYGFVEPLESTALHMLIRQIGILVNAWPDWPLHGEKLARNLNQRVGDFWDYLCWFLGLHFRFNTRKDTSFWRACRQNVCLDHHGDLLEHFLHKGALSLSPEVWESWKIPDPLWGPEGIDLLLLAQGKFPGGSQLSTLPGPSDQKPMPPAHTNLANALPQAQALMCLDQNPSLLQDLALEFRKGGPAFISLD